MNLHQWPHLTALGMIGVADKPKAGRPRLYTDEQRKERQREHTRKWRQRKRNKT